MKKELSLEEKILDITTKICSTCPMNNCCPEMECPVYQIENLFTHEYPEEGEEDEND